MFLPQQMIDLTLKPGAVYYFKNQDWNSIDFHYYVVLNFYPENDEKVIMVNATSGVDVGLKRVKIRKFPVSSFVIISPDEYDELKCNSGFDCNEITKRSSSELVELLSRGELICKKEVSDEILTKLREQVLLSRKVENNIKIHLVDQQTK